MNRRHIAFAPVIAPAPPKQQNPQETRPRKFRRVTRACDYCHKRSIKCRASDDVPESCQNCLDFAVACTYDRPAKKRGTKSGYGKQARLDASSSNDEKRDARMLLELTNSVQAPGLFGGAEKSIPEKWRTLMEVHEAKIRGLVDVYFEVIYPMYVSCISPRSSFSFLLPRT